MSTFNKVFNRDQHGRDNVEAQFTEPSRRAFDESKSTISYDVNKSSWNCENISKAKNVIESFEQLTNNDVVLLNFIQIQHSFKSFDECDLNILSKKCVNKSVVILLRSESDDKILIYWKSKDFPKFLLLNCSFQASHEDSRRIHEFIAEILAKTLSHGKLGVDQIYTDSSSNTVEVNQLTDHRGYNILQNAVESGDQRIVNIVLSNEKFKQSAIKSTTAKNMTDKDMKSKTNPRLSTFLWCLGILFLLGIPLTIYVAQKVSTKPHYNFSELTYTDQARIRRGLVNYKNVDTELNDLFPPDSKAYNKLTPEQISDVLEHKPLNLSDDGLSYLNEFVHHSWSNMSEKLQQKVLATSFIFQNVSLKFQDLYDMIPNSFNYLSSDQLRDILDGKEMKISGLTQNNTDFYIEREFVFEGANCINTNYINTRTDTLDIIQKTNKWRFFLLSSEPGAGKTVTFEQMAIRIKKNFPTKWVSYVDLKEFTRFYDESGKLDNLQQLLENILNLSEPAASAFERQLFKELFEAGQVVLLWNGFDEISPTYNSFIEKVMYTIFDKFSNVQYVCTRPLYSEQLKLKFNIQPFQLVSLNDVEQEKFIRKYLTLENVTNDKVADSVMKVVRKLSLNTPLMLRLVAEIHDRIEFLESENFYKIYEAFVAKRVENWQQKSAIGQKLLNEIQLDKPKFSMKKIYQKYALLNEFKSVYQGLKNIKMVQTAIPKSLPYEEISKMGILYIKDEFHFEFAHKTFSEFFVAQFFYENLYILAEDGNLDHENILELFHYLKYRPNVCSFMIGFLDADTTTNKKYNAQVRELLMTKYSNMFLKFLSPAYDESFEMLFKFFGQDHELLLHMLHLRKKETLYNAVYNPIYKSDILILPKLNTLGREFLTSEEHTTFIDRLDRKGIHLFGSAYLKHFAIINNKDNDKFLLDFYENIKLDLNENEQKAFLLFLISHTELLYQIKSFNVAYYRNLWKMGEELLSEPGTDKLSVFGTAMRGITTLKFWAEIQKFDNMTSFIFKKAMQHLTADEILYLFESEKLLFKATNYQPIMDNFWALYTNYTDVATQKQALLKSDSWQDVSYCKEDRIRITYMDTTKFRMFHYGLFIPYKSGGTFPTLVPIYENLLTQIELQDMILDSNDFLINMLRTNDRPTCEEFSNYLRKIFAGNEKSLKEFFNRKFGTTDLTIFEYFEGLDFAVADAVEVFTAFK